MIKNKGFTLAEVLITLAIIGIVAAMTIPTLISDYQDRVNVTKMKKNVFYFNQCIRVISDRTGPDRQTGKNRR